MGTHKRAKIADKAATIILYATAGFFLLLLVVFTLYIIIKGVMAYNPSLLSFDRTGIAVEFFNTIYLLILSLIFLSP